jgi:transposase InsO family protein
MRINIVRNLLKTKNLPAKTGAELLDVNRTSIYYQKPPASDEDLECKEFIDHIHTDNPAWGDHQNLNNTAIIWADNVIIKRWFRTFKYEEAYLTQYNNIKEARKAIKKSIHTYNFIRCHSAIGNIPPAKSYYLQMLLD